jgi:hypothetical protein
LRRNGSHGFRGVIPGAQRKFFESSPRLKPPRIFKQKQVSSQEPRTSPGQEVHRLLREGRTLPHRGRRSSGEEGQRQSPSTTAWMSFHDKVIDPVGGAATPDRQCAGAPDPSAGPISIS